MLDFFKKILSNNNSNKIETVTNNISVNQDTNNIKFKEYKIAGVTFKNENNKDIQKEIKKILREYIKEDYIDKDDMFLGYSNSDIKEMTIDSVSQYEDIEFDVKLKEDVFEDRPCIKVYMKRVDNSYTHVGYIQKRYNQINEVLDIINNYEIQEMKLNVVGGKIKKCEIETDDEYNEHFYVDTIQLDYGLRLFITYTNKKQEV